MIKEIARTESLSDDQRRYLRDNMDPLDADYLATHTSNSEAIDLAIPRVTNEFILHSIFKNSELPIKTRILAFNNFKSSKSRPHVMESSEDSEIVDFLVSKAASDPERKLLMTKKNLTSASRKLLYKGMSDGTKFIMLMSSHELPPLASEFVTSFDDMSYIMKASTHHPHEQMRHLLSSYLSKYAWI